MTPFDRLGRFVVRHAWWVVAAWIALLVVAIPFAPQVPGKLSAGGFILDDLESARAKALLETTLGAPPSALVIVFSSPTLEAGTPAFEVAAANAIRDVPTARTSRASCRTCSRRARSRPTGTRPTTSSSSTCRRTTRRRRCRSSVTECTRRLA